MIIDVHTHIPTHVDPVPSDEERWGTLMRPDKGVRRTNSFEDYLKAMGSVGKVLVFGIFQLPGMGSESVAGFTWGENVNDIAAALTGQSTRQGHRFHVSPSQGREGDGGNRPVCTRFGAERH